MASTRTFLVPLELGVLTLAACGGSDDGSASPGTGDGDDSETVESVTPADDQGDAGNEAVADADADTGADNDSGDDVDSIDDISRPLTEAGYEVTEKKLGADESWQAWVTDPTGIRIEFQNTQTRALRSRVKTASSVDIPSS